MPNDGCLGGRVRLPPRSRSSPSLLPGERSLFASSRRGSDHGGVLATWYERPSSERSFVQNFELWRGKQLERGNGSRVQWFSIAVIKLCGLMTHDTGYALKAKRVGVATNKRLLLKGKLILTRIIFHFGSRSPSSPCESGPGVNHRVIGALLLSHSDKWVVGMMNCRGEHGYHRSPVTIEIGQPDGDAGRRALGAGLCATSGHQYVIPGANYRGRYQQPNVTAITTTCRSIDCG
ncbi:hypothetical protein J6590_012301 [Homalodisca vitripennis]|nr:hypothetical protein J6590_012301 [Homalodisca vitripennis]